jgi:hypothetical protein
MVEANAAGLVHGDTAERPHGTPVASTPVAGLVLAAHLDGLVRRAVPRDRKPPLRPSVCAERTVLSCQRATVTAQGLLNGEPRDGDLSSPRLSAAR